MEGEVFTDDPKLQQILQDAMLREELGTGNAHTGPKGVLSDYRFHSTQEKQRKIQRDLQLRDGAQYADMPRNWMQRQIQEELAAKDALDKPGAEDMNELIRELNDFEEEFGLSGEVAEQEKRFADEFNHKLSLITGKASLAAAGRHRRKMFGTLREVGLVEFVPAVDDEDPDVLILIHVYQDHVTECLKLNRFLAEIAQKYPYTKFLKANSARIDSRFDDIVLPVLLVYQNGDLVDSLIRVQDDLGAEFDLGDLEDYLLDKEVITKARLVH